MKRFAILLLAVLALSLTACSSRDPKPSSSSEGSSSSSSSSQEEGEGSSSSSEPEEEEPEEESIATAQDFIAKFKTGDGFETVTFAPTMFSMPIEASGYYLSLIHICGPMIPSRWKKSARTKKTPIFCPGFQCRRRST